MLNEAPMLVSKIIYPTPGRYPSSLIVTHSLITIKSSLPKDELGVRYLTFVNFVDEQVFTISSGCCQNIATVIKRIICVTFNPYESYFVIFRKIIKAGPQIFV